MRGRQPLPVLRFSQAWELSKARSLLAYDSRTVSMMQHETFYVHACPWRSHVQGRRFALWDHFRHDEAMGCKDRMGVPASLVPWPESNAPQAWQTATRDQRVSSCSTARPFWCISWRPANALTLVGPRATRSSKETAAEPGAMFDPWGSYSGQYPPQCLCEPLMGPLKLDWLLKIRNSRPLKHRSRACPKAGWIHQAHGTRFQAAEERFKMQMQDVAKPTESVKQDRDKALQYAFQKSTAGMDERMAELKHVLGGQITWNVRRLAPVIWKIDRPPVCELNLWIFLDVCLGFASACSVVSPSLVAWTRLGLTNLKLVCSTHTHR